MKTDYLKIPLAGMKSLINNLNIEQQIIFSVNVHFLMPTLVKTIRGQDVRMDGRKHISISLQERIRKTKQKKKNRQKKKNTSH